MDARALATTALMVVVSPAVLSAARIETDNFIVTAPSEAFAQQVGEAAEYFRHHLAIEWTGEPLPGNWSSKCPIKCKVGQIGAGGATTFTFNNGEVFGWRMDIQGTEQRILDSVLPHEVSHMIFASYFRRPLPRWADEGAATLVEHESERMRQTRLLNQVINTSKRIPLPQLLNIKEYPQDMQDVLTLYAEGYSLADYLVQQKGENGKAVYLRFLNDAHRHGWDAAFKKHYDTTIDAVEEQWTGWVVAGSPPITPADGTLLASAEDAAPAVSEAMAPQQDAAPEVDPRTVIRGQSTGALAPLPELTRGRRRDMNDGAAIEAPRPHALAMSTPAAGAPTQPVVYPGQHRTTAQPPQPTITQPDITRSMPTPSPGDTPRRRREALLSAADSSSATGFPARDDSLGHPRPTSFDSSTSAAQGIMSSAPIGASHASREEGAANGLGPGSSGGFSTPGRPDEGRTPSFRGFTPGRKNSSSSARSLFSP